MKSTLKLGFLTVGILFLWDASLPADIALKAIATPNPASVSIPALDPDAKLSAIRQRDRLIIGVKDNLHPLGYRSAAGELEGLEITLARQLGQELFDQPIAVKLVPLSNRERIEALTQNRVDLVIAYLTATDDRRRLVQFSPAYHTSGIQVVTALELTHLAALKGQPVGLLAGSDAIGVVRARLPRVELRAYPSYQAALRGLETGEVVAFAGDSVVVSSWERAGYRRLGPLLSAEPLAIALPKGIGQDTLRRRIDQVVRGWRASGWLEQERERWGL